MHPVHVTLTSIDQAAGSDSLKVFFRMYYDDFLLDYRLYDPDFNTGKYTDDKPFPAELLNDYFNHNVRIYINNKLITGQVVSLKILNNEIFMNLLYHSEKDPGKIRVRNRVLTRLYRDQTNMIYININRNQDAMRLTPDHFRETVSF